MKRVKNPCYLCNLRHPTCHCKGQCPKGNVYQEYVAYKQALNKKIHEEKQNKWACEEIKAQGIKRATTIG